MDTSQLMDQVVHRQLCCTFFTQVPIELPLQLGLDFLFADFCYLSLWLNSQSFKLNEKMDFNRLEMASLVSVHPFLHDLQ